MGAFEHGAQVVWIREPAAIAAAGADARFFAFAADVAVARARGGDAAVPARLARAWIDRAAMAHPPRAGRDRQHRGDGTGANGLPARAEPVAHSARSRNPGA